MRKRILITAGPIPGQLDSVKFVTNRFKGGLMFKMAYELATLCDHTVTVMKWKHTEVPAYIKNNIGTSAEIEIVDVDDVHDYFAKVTEKEYDAFILGAAVANLIPKNPWKGKFPSHNYKVGDTINIEFEIAPRAIDEVKKKYPRALLVGYKLFDGPDEELEKAGWHTLTDSKANVVFCNHPSWAKTRKKAILPDGTTLWMDYDAHVVFIDRMIKLRWYKTEINEVKTAIPTDVIACLESKLKWVISQNRRNQFSEYDFGTVAMRYKDGFVTTTRGKKSGDFGKFTYVSRVNHGQDRTVYADEKATLNAPLISKLFENTPPEYDLVMHGHFALPNEKEYPYLFPGTTEENEAENQLSFNIHGHGCYIVAKCGNNNTE